MKINRKFLVTILKIGVSLILLWLIFRMVDWKTFKTILASYSGSYLGLLIGVGLLDRSLMAYKWNLLLRSRGINLPWIYCFRIYMIGNFLANFLPTGVTSDFYRIYRVSVCGGTVSKATASVLIERVLGLVSLAALALFGLLLVLAWKKYGFLWTFIGPVALFLLVTLLGFFFSIRLQPREWVSRFLPRYKGAMILQKLFGLHDAYAEYRGRSYILWVFLCLSFLEQILLVVRVYLSVLTLNIPIDPVYVFGISPTCHMLAYLPVLISPVGVTEGLYVFFFSKIGMSVTQVISFAFLLRVTGLLVPIVGGVFYLLESLKFRKEIKFSIGDDRLDYREKVRTP